MVTHRVLLLAGVIMRGRSFVITGPSGAGKSTMLKSVMPMLDLAFSVSATTRDPRPGEVDGEDYFFVSKEKFQADLAAGAFLEHATVFGRSYGTYRAPVEEMLTAGKHVVLDLDIQGHRSLRETLPEAVHIFIAPPSVEVARDRLFGRDNIPWIVDSRMSDYDKIMSARHEYDTILINDNLNTATMALFGVILGEIKGLL